MAQFEGYERREAKILATLKEYGISSIDECKEICDAKGIDPYTIVQETQPICFENAKWAYTVGAAIAIKSGCKKAADAAAAIGVGLQSFCIPGSVAENRKVGLAHGNIEQHDSSASLQVTRALPPLRALSKLLLTLTRFVRISSALSLTVSAKTPLISFQE